MITELLISLAALSFLEILLGIDNVIFVSIIIGKLKKEERAKANLIWMIVGIAMRLFLLFTLATFLKSETILFSVLEHHITIKDLILLAGGLFLLVNTTLEIHDKLEGESGTEESARLGSSFASVITKLLMVDLVFSIDGVVTAIGMANVAWIQITAVVVAMIFMFLFAGKISDFIHQHPTFKMLALSFLILIGFLLVVEGIHVEKFELPKGYVYFAMAFSFGVEILNLRVRKKSKPVELHGRGA